MDTLLQSYAEPEKIAYLASIAGLASADRTASAQELDFLRSLSEAAQLSAAGTEQVLRAAQDSTNQSIAQHLDTLKGSELRFPLIADVISFAKADGQYSPDEQAMILKMADYLGVNTQQVGALAQAVEQVAEQPTATSPDMLANNLNGGGLGGLLSRVGIPSGALTSGLLGILAPILISKVLSRGAGNTGGYGGGGSMGGGGMGGGLLGALGGLLGGAVLGNVLGGGGQTQTMPQSSGGGLGAILGGVLGGGQPAPSQRQPNLGGGLGTLMGVLGGLGGRGSYGGLGSVLGSVLGGR